MDLKLAAMKLSTPKKSLDDYMMVCKEAHASGFEFLSHLDAQFTVVREFIRQTAK